MNGIYSFRASGLLFFLLEKLDTLTNVYAQNCISSENKNRMFRLIAAAVTSSE